MNKIASVYNYENPKLGTLMLVHQFKSTKNMLGFNQTFNIIPPLSNKRNLRDFVEKLNMRPEDQGRDLSIALAKTANKPEVHPTDTAVIMWLETIFKRKGFGKEMLGLVANLSQEYGFEKLAAYSVYEAIDFYAKHGFEKVNPDQIIQKDQPCHMHALVKDLKLPKIILHKDKEFSKVANDIYQNF